MRTLSCSQSTYCLCIYFRLSFVCVSSLRVSRDLVLVPVRPRTGQHWPLCKGPWLPGTQAGSLASPPRGDGASERLSRLLDGTALRLLILDGSREPAQHRWHWSSWGKGNSQFRSLPPCGIPCFPTAVECRKDPQGDSWGAPEEEGRSVEAAAVAAAGPPLRVGLSLGLCYTEDQGGRGRRWRRRVGLRQGAASPHPLCSCRYPSPLPWKDFGLFFFFVC